MSCPCFYPTEARALGSGREGAMLPLGGSWRGECRAEAGNPWQPDENSLRICNLGYARGACTRFPSPDGPDAVRFSIRRDDEAGVLLRWVMERDHHPFAHGSLEYSPEAGAFRSPAADGPLLRQAEAYVESFLRRKAEARGH